MRAPPSAAGFTLNSYPMSRFIRVLAGVLLLSLLSACGKTPWNDPYPESERGKNTLYSVFTERPKHLDPARSYSSNEVVFTGQIYEPPLQYQYLKRPYTLEPLTAERMPEVAYFDAQGQALPADAAAETVAYSDYLIQIKPGIIYQPHPAFEKDAQGRYPNHALRPEQIAALQAPTDLPQQAKRELIADDYVFQIKRLAHPRLNSPIYGLMSDYILGLKDYGDLLSAENKKLKRSNGDDAYLDLQRYPLPGAEVVDRYTYRIRIKGKYAQFKYWLAMPFFAPVPWEVEKFYAQPGMKAKNFVLDWYPVGTGPYLLAQNNPNKQMVLLKNPNFHGERYPSEGEPADQVSGLLADANKSIPFIDRAIYTLEKEDIPYWNKFLQGYYDASGISSDTFDQAVNIGGTGEAALTPDMQAKGIQLKTTVSTSIQYTGFNMQDPVIGGNSERARKLRQAVSIAIDSEEMISIFRNGRGIAAQGPIPPGIFGYQEGEAGINQYLYAWANGRAERKPITEAKRLMAEAGYPGGRDASTGQPLLLHFDTAAVGPDAKSRLEWLVKQFKKIDLQLVIRSTDYNRFQDKMLKGDAQIFEWGWNADYPDPENFLFLLYGPNKKVGLNGENAANYDNPEFNRLFEQMKNMDNSPERQAVITQMVAIAQRDAPWVWGFYPKNYALYHAWYFNAKPNLMANNGLKYLRIDPQVRERSRSGWNQPVLWPIGVLILVLVAVLIPAGLSYRRSLHRAPPIRKAP